ncbi:MAG: DNA translocase FtsK [Lactobacillales bacterium]|jgi:S-DNA-T family DNA segregation ATPase FtsK/SpoIIIE|nr:DNA translocase FtsK [Lactobacillales bacterium]
MAKKKKPVKKTAKKTRKKTRKELQHDAQVRRVLFGLVGILLFVFGIFKLGFLGSEIANVLRFFAGNTFQFLGVLGIVFLLVRMFKVELKISSRRVVGGVLAYLGVLVMLHAVLFSQIVTRHPKILDTTWQTLLMDIKKGVVTQNVGGGMIGGAIYSATHFLVAQPGSYLFSIFLIVLGVAMLTNIHFQEIQQVVSGFLEKMSANSEKREAKRAEKQQAKIAKAQQKAEEKAEKEAQREAEEVRINTVREKTRGEQLAEEVQDHFPELEDGPRQLDLPLITMMDDNRMEDSVIVYEDEQGRKRRVHQETGELLDSEDTENETPLDFEIPQEVENLDYKLPPSSLLNEIPPTDQTGERHIAEHNIAILEQAFKSFGIDIKVVNVSIGPAVTKYEVKPPIGVKVSRIKALTDDIALALAAKDVRMEAPIPGKSLIGIEIPNTQISTVSFRDIIESVAHHPDRLLEVPLGRDISGHIQTTDIARMPHLLIAGSTGSGKSVAVNGIISGILMQAKPNEVKMVMVDPKMVELSVYNGIPHLLTPVVTNPRKASQALQKVVEEMERRYELFSQFGIRNITGYNTMVARENLENGENHPNMPLIVVIVDELADLMMVASKEVEDAIVRLGQKARAAGIHMILATQRPSVDVISGLIKANVPSRIAFAVSSGTDSRTILDQNGAEKLLGRGDMLYKPIDANHPTRVQGAFISDEEVERIVDFVKEQQDVQYNEKFEPGEVNEGNGNGTNNSSSDHDEYFEDAKAMVIEMQKASTSMIQRRFGTGYNRAARIIDELEEAGVIGPPVGTKPRQVLILPEPEEDTQEGLEEDSKN